MFLKHYIKLYFFRKKWRKLNKHNNCMAKEIFDINKVKVGRYTYGSLEVLDYGKSGMLEIGSYCSIGDGTVFLLSAEHPTKLVSTFPFKIICMNYNINEAFSKGNIIIEDDVWVGYGATILSGVKIGQGAVIAACAVVTTDIPAYAIAGGNPARIIKYRFDNDIIDKLIKCDYSAIDKQFIENNLDKLYAPFAKEDRLDWLPQKGE